MVPLTLHGTNAVLSVVDLIAVVLFAAALGHLIRVPRRADRVLAELARTGAILSILGGIARVAWRVISLLTDADLAVLAGAHLALLAPGMMFVAAAVAASSGIAWVRRPARGLARLGVALLVLAVAFGLAQSGVTGLGVLLTVVSCIAFAAAYARAAVVAGLRELTVARNLLLAAIPLALLAASAGAGAATTWRWVEQALHVAAGIAALRGAAIVGRRWTPS